jgi:hypothetical protein
MTADSTQQGAKIGELIMKASTDKELKAQLLKDGAAVFSENGISIPKGITLKILEDTSTLYHFIIPPAPDNSPSNAGTGNTASHGPEQLLFRAWNDKSFKKALISDTMQILKENGIGTPEGVTIKALEDTSKVTHLVIPMARIGELSDADLEKVAGGKHGGCHEKDAYTVNVCWPIADGIGKTQNALGMCGSKYWGTTH